MNVAAGAWFALGVVLAASSPPEADVPAVDDYVEVVGAADDDAVEAARRVSLGPAQLRVLPAETLAEVMAELPGVVVLFDAPVCATPMVVVRGFFGGGEVDYLGLEVDGVPRAATESGVVDWRSIRLEDVERIDLLAGPAMRRGGVDPALAGVLRVTSRAVDASPHARVALSLASFDSQSASASCGGAFGRWSGVLAADGATTGGHRDHSAAQEGGATLRIDRSVGPGHLELSTSARWRDREEPGPLSETELTRDARSSNPLFAEDRERAATWGVAAHWEMARGRMPLAGHLAADASRKRFLRTLLVAEGYGDRALRRVETSTLTAGLSIPGEIALGRRAGLRLAVDSRNERAEIGYDLATGGSRAAEVAQRDRVAGELGLALRPHSRFEIDTSVRGDLLRDTSTRTGSARQDAWSPRIGVVWAVTGEGRRGFDLFGELGRAFKAPTLDQLYDPRPFAGPQGDFTLSNPELVPQRTRGWEVGARGRTAQTTWRLVAYRLIVENEIDFDPASFRYANIGRSRHEGLEASWRWDAGRFGELRAAYARSHAEAEGAFPSGQLKNIPRDVVRVGWNVRLGRGLELGLRQSLLAGRWADDDRRRPLDDAWRTDARFSRDLGGLRLRLDVLNVFDEDALELAYLLPTADGAREALHGFAPAPRVFRFGVERSW